MAMIEKGQHLFFPMKNGRTIPDKDQNPRYCLNRENAERFRWYYDELVEYAPKKRGEWLADEDGWNCSRCGAHITKKTAKTTSGFTARSADLKTWNRGFRGKTNKGLREGGKDGK